MNSEDDIRGREFDWFAMDEKGQVALFSTAGRGDAPRSVLANTEKHDALSERLETPHWGTEKVWEDYAGYGLFVFDWKLNDGPYRKVAEPGGAISGDLKSRIGNLAGLPVFNVDFAEIAAFRVEEDSRRG